MTIEERAESAAQLKRTGQCNCCQAVAKAFSDTVDVREEDLLKMAAGFAGGMGCMEATCGALCAAEMLLGLLTYEGKPVGRNARELHQAFAAKCGATICKELKGRDSGVVLCECDDCVRHAVEVLEEALNN